LAILSWYGEGNINDDTRKDQVLGRTVSVPGILMGQQGGGHDYRRHAGAESPVYFSQ